VAAESCAQLVAMVGQRRFIPLLTELVEQLCRPFYVCEQEGDSAAWQVSHGTRMPPAREKSTVARSWRADRRAVVLTHAFALQTAWQLQSLQNRSGRATHGWVGSTPAPLR